MLVSLLCKWRQRISKTNPFKSVMDYPISFFSFTVFNLTMHVFNDLQCLWTVFSVFNQSQTKKPQNITGPAIKGQGRLSSLPSGNMEVFKSTREQHEVKPALPLGVQDTRLSHKTEAQWQSRWDFHKWEIICSTFGQSELQDWKT